MIQERVVHRSVIPSSLEEVQEKKGSMNSDLNNERLMHSVLENDREKIDKGKLISEAINLGFSSFNPDMIFEKLVKDYRTAKNIFGERIIRQLSGYSPSYVEKNIHIPEFRKELLKGINRNVEKMKEEMFLDRENSFTEKALELASLTLYFEEIDNLIPSGILGEKLSRKSERYGTKQDVRDFRRDRYRDIAIKSSVKMAIRREHKNLIPKDLKTYERQAKGQSYLVYAIDASGSMRGEKIESCKKAGIALAFKAIDEKDKVGLIAFGSDVKTMVMPTDNFMLLLKEITKVRASQETNIAITLQEAVKMFPDECITKHLILLTDALPTTGSTPEKETIDAASSAKNHGITISLVGVNLDKKGKKLAEKIVEIGQGKLYAIKTLKEVDSIVLEDYYTSA